MATQFTLGCVILLATSASAAFNLCARNETDIIASGKWDTCGPNNLGRHKSVSVCYYHTPTKKYIYRYDFFTCLRKQHEGKTYYVLNPGNCTGAQSPDANGTFVDIFNRYDPSKRTCTLPPPATPPPSNSSMFIF